MCRIGHGVNRVSLRAEPNPAGAPDKFFRAEADTFAAVPRHHFSDLGRDFGWRLGRQFFFLYIVLLEKSAVIEHHEHLWFSLTNDREIRIRDEQVLAEMKHHPAQI